MKKFKCLNCGRLVSINEHIGTAHRNHCPYCLWSKHVDLEKAGDRKSTCRGGMKPIGLTLKRIKPDKYQKDKKGELMIVHLCQTCGKISLNRVAADDEVEMILSLLKLKTEDIGSEIKLLTEKDVKVVKFQLFGVS